MMLPSSCGLSRRVALWFCRLISCGLLYAALCGLCGRCILMVSSAAFLFCRLAGRVILWLISFMAACRYCRVGVRLIGFIWPV